MSGPKKGSDVPVAPPAPVDVMASGPMVKGLANAMERALGKSLAADRIKTADNLTRLIASFEMKRDESGTKATKAYTDMMDLVKDMSSGAEQVGSKSELKIFKEQQRSIEQAARNLEKEKVISKDERAEVQQAMGIVNQKMKEEAKVRIGFATQISDSLKENLPEITGVLAGVLGGSPAAMMLGGFVGDIVKGRKEKAEDARQKTIDFYSNQMADLTKQELDVMASTSEATEELVKDTQKKIIDDEESNAELVKAINQVEDAVLGRATGSAIIDINQAPLERLGKSDEEDSPVNDNIVQLVKFEEVKSRDLIENVGKAEEERIEDNATQDKLIETLEGIEGAIASDGFGLGGKDKKEGGGFSLSGILGSIGGVPAILGILAAIGGIVDFFSAEDMDGDGIVGLNDRLANVFGGFYERILKLGDMIAGWVGFDTDMAGWFHDNVTVPLSQIFAMDFDEFIGVFKMMFDDIKGYFVNMKDAIVGKISSVINEVIADFLGIIDEITAPIKALRDKLGFGEESTNGFDILKKSDLIEDKINIGGRKDVLSPNAANALDNMSSAQLSNILEKGDFDSDTEKLLGEYKNKAIERESKLEDNSKAGMANKERTARIEETQKELRMQQKGGASLVNAPVSANRTTISSSSNSVYTRSSPRNPAGPILSPA